MSIFLLFMILLLYSPIVAYDLQTGRPNGMAGSAVLSSPTVSGFLSCPSGLLEINELYLESGYQRKYELSDLDKVYFAGGYRMGPFSLAVGFSQFGRSNYYIEQIAKSAIAYKYRNISGAVILSGRLMEIVGTAGTSNLNAVSSGLAAGYHYKKFHLGLVIDNINQPKLYEKDEKQNILYNVYGEIEGSDRFSITARLMMEQSEKPIISVGQYIRLAGNHALFWGVSNNPLTYGGGIELYYRGFGIIYATSYHPVLGFTHNISLNYKQGL